MKSKKQTQKMKLGKVTVARLNQNEEANVKGGAWDTYYCSSSCNPIECDTTERCTCMSCSITSC